MRYTLLFYSSRTTPLPRLQCQSKSPSLQCQHHGELCRQIGKYVPVKKSSLQCQHHVHYAKLAVPAPLVDKVDKYVPVKLLTMVNRQSSIYGKIDRRSPRCTAGGTMVNRQSSIFRKIDSRSHRCPQNTGKIVETHCSKR